MILIDGHPVLSSRSSLQALSLSLSLSLSQPSINLQGIELLISLLEHPTLAAASSRLKAAPETKFPPTEPSSPPVKHVYVFQREFATVDPSLVELVGTDEATTCVGLVIRNRSSGMTSVGHLDFTKVVDKGLAQMLPLVVDQESDTILDVHLIGGFEDVLYEHLGTTRSENHKYENGYSWPLCSKIIEALQKSQQTFHLQTLCVLGHNTRRDSYGNPFPIISGFMVNTSSGLIVPATFNRGSRCPDEIVRRIRATRCSGDSTWKGKLLDTYDTHHDRIQIAACSWKSDWGQIAFSLQQLSDSEILFRCSTSPSAESPDFVDNERRIWSYLIKYPDWRQTFPARKPRVFERTATGDWMRLGTGE